MKPLTFVKRKKNKANLIKINNQLPASSCSSSCVVFSLSTFALMIDRTLSRIWRSAIQWKSEVCTLLSFTMSSCNFTIGNFLCKHTLFCAVEVFQFIFWRYCVVYPETVTLYGGFRLKTAVARARSVKVTLYVHENLTFKQTTR